MKRSPMPQRKAPMARGGRIAKKASPTDWPTSVRNAVHRRSGGRCEIGIDGCAGRAVQIHHRQRRMPGNSTLDNALDVCTPCHNYAHAHPAEAIERGWIVSSHSAG